MALGWLARGFVPGHSAFGILPSTFACGWLCPVSRPYFVSGCRATSSFPALYQHRIGFWQQECRPGDRAGIGMDPFRQSWRRRARIFIQIRRGQCLLSDGTGQIVLRRQWNRGKTQRMKTTIKSLGAVILGGGLFISGCAKKQVALFQSLKNPELAAQLKSFVAEKEAQANAATNKMPSEFQAFFAVAAKGDWLAVSNAFVEFRKYAGQYEHSGKIDERLRGTAWQAVLETWGALDAFGEGDEKYSLAIGTNIIASIPPGSIYFGGTDPGRFIVTALQKSHVNADPFFTLTQNALADGTYLDYLRAMYGEKIYVPTREDSQRCFQDYIQDAQTRQIGRASCRER